MQGYTYQDDAYCIDCKPKAATRHPRVCSIGHMTPGTTCIACGKRWVLIEWLEAGGAWVAPDPQAAHTPGPWRADILSSLDGKPYRVTKIGGPGETIAIVYTSEADARLITRSTQLLAIARRQAHHLTSEERRWLDEI